MKKQILPIILSLILLITGSCRPETSEKERRIQTVGVKIVYPVKIKTSFPIKCSGILTSKIEIKLSFKTSGIIEEILVDEGMSVQKDQILARLNLSEIDAMVEQARLGYERAERDLVRAENLYSDSVATLEQLQNAKTAVLFSKAQLRVAEFNRAHSVIKAPAQGKILKKLGEKNETIAAGHPLFLFSSSESDWVFRTALPDVDIVKIQNDDRAVIDFDAFPGEHFKAKVTEIAEAADPYTGTYEVELSLTSRKPNFISGLMGKAQITPSETKLYEALPIKVLHDAEGMTGFLYVVRDSTYEKRQVDLAGITDSLIYVNPILDTTCQIIAEGAEYLVPGSSLEIIE